MSIANRKDMKDRMAYHSCSEMLKVKQSVKGELILIDKKEVIAGD
jgi:hypothetical protein